MSTITDALPGVVTDALLGVALALLGTAAFAGGMQKTVYGFGTTPSDAELARFVSPLPDGRGLPPGSGSVLEGKSLYQQQCASCHGENLQGGIGDRLVGGRGSLVHDDPAKAPVKTVESYWPYATTLFDYTKRAMPLNATDSSPIGVPSAFRPSRRRRTNRWRSRRPRSDDEAEDARFRHAVAARRVASRSGDRRARDADLSDVVVRIS